MSEETGKEAVGRVRAEHRDTRPDVCRLNCAACARKICTGAAALARECRADAVEGLANGAAAESVRAPVIMHVSGCGAAVEEVANG
jgi:sulfite reductase beta subunit-like hemoprotein